MLPLILVFLPFLSAAAVWLHRSGKTFIRVLAVAGALLHFLLTALLCFRPDVFPQFPKAELWLGADDPGKVFLGITSFLFLCVTLHTVRWLPAEKEAQETQEHPEGLLPLPVFISCLLAFEGTMSAVILARDFGLLWVAVEATTLVSAPLILFHRSARSLEAMWKYLLICSVGIGLALLGTMFLAASLPDGEGGLNFLHVLSVKDQIRPGWFRAAFILILAGYGTKMGLAPFHTWLPDAHSESPGTVSALLSGALLNCSLLGILRFYDAAPENVKPFCCQLLTALGLLSLLTAAFFTVRQNDYKRLLAYSSIEHMGLLAIFWAASLRDTALLHLLGHSLIKMTLFLLAGNFLLACGTRRTDLLGGLIRKMPVNAVLFLGSILMICGMPPSPLFITELKLIVSLPPVLGGTVLLLLFIIFSGMTHTVLNLLLGPEGKVLPAPALAEKAEKLTLIPGTVFLLVLAAGIRLIAGLL